MSVFLISHRPCLTCRFPQRRALLWLGPGCPIFALKWLCLYLWLSAPALPRPRGPGLVLPAPPAQSHLSGPHLKRLPHQGTPSSSPFPYSTSSRGREVSRRMELVTVPAHPQGRPLPELQAATFWTLFAAPGSLLCQLCDLPPRDPPALPPTPIY